MDVEKLIVLLGIIAGAFKALTSGFKDISEMKNKKRRPPTKKKRRKN